MVSNRVYLPNLKEARCRPSKALTVSKYIIEQTIYS